MILFVACQPDLGRDEFAFRSMGHRLSFVSSPASDYDIAADDTLDAVERDEPGRRPARASSDPSIAPVDNILPRPVEPPPAPPTSEMPSYLADDPHYVCTAVQKYWFSYVSVRTEDCAHYK